MRPAPPHATPAGPRRPAAAAARPAPARCPGAPPPVPRASRASGSATREAASRQAQARRVEVMTSRSFSMRSTRVPFRRIPLSPTSTIAQHRGVGGRQCERAGDPQPPVPGGGFGGAVGGIDGGEGGGEMRDRAHRVGDPAIVERSFELACREPGGETPRQQAVEAHPRAVGDAVDHRVGTARQARPTHPRWSCVGGVARGAEGFDQHPFNGRRPSRSNAPSRHCDGRRCRRSCSR